jgi:hypothetical protein
MHDGLGGRPRFSTPSRCGAIKGFGDGSRRAEVDVNKGLDFGGERLRGDSGLLIPPCPLHFRGSGRHRTTQVARGGGIQALQKQDPRVCHQSRADEALLAHAEGVLV